MPKLPKKTMHTAPQPAAWRAFSFSPAIFRALRALAIPLALLLAMPECAWTANTTNPDTRPSHRAAEQQPEQCPYQHSQLCPQQYPHQYPEQCPASARRAVPYLLANKKILAAYNDRAGQISGKPRSARRHHMDFKARSIPVRSQSKPTSDRLQTESEPHLFQAQTSINSFLCDTVPRNPAVGLRPSAPAPCPNTQNTLQNPANADTIILPAQNPLNRPAMKPKNRLRTLAACAALSAAATALFLNAQTPAPAPLKPSFDQTVKPFLNKSCFPCHNENNATSGVRVDQLDASLAERHLKLWEHIQKRVEDQSMPPKGFPQPSPENRRLVGEWIAQALDIARSRPTPKNGLTRRLTVAQYRNTLRELLLLEDDLTEILPPDAISRDGFVNNRETLQLSPLLLETYFEIAEEALKRAIVDPASKPKIQNFRVDLGAGINKNPIPDELILGAGSQLLEKKDVLVTQLTAKKPFPFDPFFMQTKFRFIEGYQGNDTVRGWRDFDSIYHAVFADMRGSRGYPKGHAYSTVPEGLLLRPSIPNDEIFTADGTYGPKANFKIPVRELPDYGRFRVTVTAAKYNDGLLLDTVATPQPAAPNAIVIRDTKSPQTLTIPAPGGVYQVDAHPVPPTDNPPAPDASKLSEALAAEYNFNADANPGLALHGSAKLVASPFGKAVSLTVPGGHVEVPPSDALKLGTEDFTISVWINTRNLRKAGILARGLSGYGHGWYLDMPDNRGALRLETSGTDNVSNGALVSPPGMLRPNQWHHIAAVVRRDKKGESKLYVNGYLVASGNVGPLNIDNEKLGLHIGRIPEAPQFRGEIDEVRIYKRALGEAEVQALVEPGRRYARRPPDKPQDIHLSLGGREFSGPLQQTALLTVRLPAGPLPVKISYQGARGLDKLVLTPIVPGTDLHSKFLAFEKRAPKLGVHLGFRRDCGSTFAPVGQPQAVFATTAGRYTFEGAIRNYPNPEVEKNNVNYLAGVREIAVRSEYTDGRDMPRLVIKSVEFEGPFYDAWPPPTHTAIFNPAAATQPAARPTAANSFAATSPTRTGAVAETPANAEAILRNFATRAYRCPATAAEVAALVAVYNKSAASGRNFREAVTDALQVALTSPQFLLLVETSRTPAPEPIEGFELASKLSYFLWNGPPDATTRGLAAAGTLRKNLDAEVTRLIAHPKFTRFTQEFVSQWLALDKFHVLEPDKNRFPDLTRDIRAHLGREPIEFVQHLFRKNLPARNLVQSDFVLANEAVATYYDLPSKTESGFRFVPVAHGRRELGGVLTQPAILAGLSDGRESNPIKRGAWLARRIVAEPPDDPPPNVPALKEDNPENLTLRQRLEQHRNQPGCQQCHTKIDPWGIALEQFDASGRLKQQAADARSTLPDKTEVDGIDGLRRYLAEDRIDQVAFSVLKHLATYGTGRTLTYAELNFLKKDALKLRPAGYRMQDMIRYVVNGNFFLEK